MEPLRSKYVSLKTPQSSAAKRPRVLGSSGFFLFRGQTFSAAAACSPGSPASPKVGSVLLAHNFVALLRPPPVPSSPISSESEAVDDEDDDDDDDCAEESEDDDFELFAGEPSDSDTGFAWDDGGL